ncbi:hypothetical protein FLA_4174 [Filimonas lacunae]|nr:hypothetical protein FLA_4174 [Filimonas lacunae]
MYSSDVLTMSIRLKVYLSVNRLRYSSSYMQYTYKYTYQHKVIPGIYCSNRKKYYNYPKQFE